MSVYEYARTSPLQHVDPGGLAIKKIRCHHRTGKKVDYMDVFIRVPPQTRRTGCPGNWSFFKELSLTDDEKRLERICRSSPDCAEADLARLLNGVERFAHNFKLLGTNTCSRWAGGCTSLLLDKLNRGSIGVGMEVWDYNGWLSKVWVPYLLPDGLSTYHAVVCVKIRGKRICYFDNGAIGEGLILKGDHLFFWDDIDLDIFDPGYKPCP